VDIQATYDDERVNRDGTWVRTVSAELSFEDQKNVGRTRRANIWAQWDHLYRNDMVLGYFVGASIGEQTVNTGERCPIWVCKLAAMVHANLHQVWCWMAISRPLLLKMTMTFGPPQ